MSLLDRREAKEELEAGRELLQSLQTQAGVRQELLFRAPYGEISDELLRQARSAGFTVIGWETDSLDWKGYGTDAVVKLVLQKNQLKKGHYCTVPCGCGTYAGGSGTNPSGDERNRVAGSKLLLPGGIGADVSSVPHPF